MRVDRLIGALAFLSMFAGVCIEQHLWDETMNKTPDEWSVTAFEIEEEGLSVVLTSAIEDARAVVQYLVQEHDLKGRRYMSFERDFHRLVAADVDRADEMKFRAMRVLGLLEATRERETGEKA